MVKDIVRARGVLPVTFTRA